MLSKKEIRKKITFAFWDYNINPEDIYLIAVGKKKGGSFFTKEKVLIRLFERLSWYEILDMFGKEFLTKNLTPKLIKKISKADIRKKYEFIRKILQDKALPSSGWSVENRKRLEASVLSNRWYSA